jgi:UDP-glucose 4-epimerase
MVRILVTGGGGFIGSAVCALLRGDGHEVFGYDLPRKDIRNLSSLMDYSEDLDAVIHLAGVLGTHELFDTPQRAVDVNVTGTLNVLEACRWHGMRYVGITMPAVFPSLYTATKVCATRMATAYHLTHGVPVSHVRAFNAFGPGQAHGPGHPQKIIPTFATKIWNEEPVPVWGDGNQTVDLIYVDDLAQMLVDALEFGNDEVFDGGTGFGPTVNEVVDLVAFVAKQKASVEYLPMRRGEIPTNICATGEGWDKLGWRPSFNVLDLKNTVEWYKP